MKEIDMPMYQAAIDTIQRLEAEIETERLRLAGCGVVATANTLESAALTRISKDSLYYSASMGDVEAAVDREMALRDRVAELEAEVERLRKELNALDTVLRERDKQLIAALRKEE